MMLFKVSKLKILWILLSAISTRYLKVTFIACHCFLACDLFKNKIEIYSFWQGVSRAYSFWQGLEAMRSNFMPLGKNLPRSNSSICLLATDLPVG
jgi:hypothetical protein